MGRLFRCDVSSASRFLRVDLLLEQHSIRGLCSFKVTRAVRNRNQIEIPEP